MTFVISKNGEKLMPTSNVKKVRKLLRSGRAEIYKHFPFTIKLLYDTTNGKQDIELTEDTGYQTIGVSVKSEKHEYFSGEFELLKNEKKRHDEQRREHRRPRRNHKRYRAPRFNNRKGHKLAPNLKNKADRHVDIVKMFMKVCPVTSVTLEMGQFDTQVLKAYAEEKPVPVGKGYQHGERYGYDTLRAAVLERDDHKCVLCGKEGILEMHHFGYWKGDKSDRMGNLGSLCLKCHSHANHKKSGKLWGLEPKFKSLKSAAFMNTVKWYIYEQVKEFGVTVHMTYGVSTKRVRIDRNIEKSHANDAYSMGDFHPSHRAHTEYFVKRRRNNRILEKFYDAKYIDIRDGGIKKGAELSCGRRKRSIPRDNPDSLRIYHGKKMSKGRRAIRKTRYPLQPGDVVLYNDKKAITSGCHNKGTRCLVNGRSISVKKVKIIYHANNWTRKEITG